MYGRQGLSHQGVEQSVITIAEWIRISHKRLQGRSDTARLDVQVLLAWALNRPRAWLMAHSDEMLTTGQLELLEQSVQRLEAGEPLPYLLGRWEFYGLEFAVTPATLIPRPETELLVGQALDWLRANPDRRQAADVGTGSGCIAVTLASHVTDLRVVATDVSVPALQVACDNARRHNVYDRVDFIHSSSIPVAVNSLDLICANPPYIPTATLESLPVARWEPRLALDGGADGFDCIYQVLLEAQRALSPGGRILFEIEASQGAAAVRLAQERFPGAGVCLHRDLAGLDRLVAIQVK
jgi:release factor glutamine methyltransferase